MMNESRKEYIPCPEDLSGVLLSEEITVISELIAKNVHEVWAKARMEEGWTYGEFRDDHLKKHPCLVPYEDLPEAEKAYDRNTALNTLKLLIKRGFKIQKYDEYTLV